jgi:hypothetical protein
MIGSALTAAFLEPGSAAAFFEFANYINGDSVDKKTGEADTTAHGTSTKTFIPGLNENAWAFELMWNNTPAYAQRPQTRFRQFQQGQTVVTFRIRPYGAGSGLEEIGFTGFVTGMKDNTASDNKPVSSSVSLRINQLTYSVQA